MTFISDTNEHLIDTNDIVIIEDAVFEILEVPELTKYEDANKPIAGPNAVTFVTGFVIDFRVTKLKLSQGAIRTK